MSAFRLIGLIRFTACIAGMACALGLQAETYPSPGSSLVRDPNCNHPAPAIASDSVGPLHSQGGLSPESR